MKSDPVEAVIEAMERKGPSKAAMRAAEEVCRRRRLGATRYEAAEIIDRETGLPELIAACKALIPLVPRIDCPWVDDPGHIMHGQFPSAVEKAKAALAKVEGT